MLKIDGLKLYLLHPCPIRRRGGNSSSWQPQKPTNSNRAPSQKSLKNKNKKGFTTGVGHDWGSIIAWQAAAQSWEWDQYQDQSGYIDRLIILNGPHMVILYQNFYSRLIDFIHYRNLKSLIRNPMSTFALSWQKF
ncbi:hypothetical protein RclHR1_02710004 [Rhizophagus clarus]|uniref:Uncharacterized protein n=1 Tax=Rhizophagus clarus TaxID=94130 RepID=A0A2Z6R2Q5_9GLOM|nr:hypothetical protein RclHR1_02710004 [Rhizophagus clarus]